MAGLVESHVPRRGAVRVSDEDGRVTVELRLEVAWGVSIADVGRSVQELVREYLRRMAELEPAAVNVVVDAVAAPPAR